MRKRVGDDAASRHRCFSPPVDDLSAYADLGTTARRRPRPRLSTRGRGRSPHPDRLGPAALAGRLRRRLQADLPGASHRSTLGALHRRGIGRDGVGDASRLLGGDPSSNPMRQAIRAAAGLLGPCVSVSHLIGAPGQVSGRPRGPPRPGSRRPVSRGAGGSAPDAAPADLIVAGNHPWPGDPMQSFKVLLQHRASCRVGGVLVGFFWTDPAELDRSFPMPAMRAIAASGAVGGWSLRHGLALADRVAGAVGSPSAFMIHWARELVVDRAVLVYSPVLFERIGPRLGPIRLFADQPSLWQAAARALPGVTAPRVRLFPQGGLTYAATKDPPTLSTTS